LERVDHAAFIACIEASRETKRALWEVEQERLGVDHAALGGRLAENWNLPGDLRGAIERHHLPGEGALDPLVASVHAADMLCRQQSLGMDGDFGPIEIAPAAMKLLRLDERAIKEVLVELEHRLKEAEEFLKFSRGA
jgi:HD-like signal output (HDOD) protein